MEYTLAGRGVSDTDLVGRVTSLDTIVSGLCLAQVLGRPSVLFMLPKQTFLEPQRAVTQALTLLAEIRFIVWCLR